MREWENGRMGGGEPAPQSEQAQHNTTQHSNTNSKHEASKTRLTDIKLFIPGWSQGASPAGGPSARAGLLANRGKTRGRGSAWGHWSAVRMD